MLQVPAILQKIQTLASWLQKQEGMVSGMGPQLRIVRRSVGIVQVDEVGITSISIWRFPKMGAPPIHPFKGDFPL